MGYSPFVLQEKKLYCKMRWLARRKLYCNIGWLEAGLCHDTVHCIVIEIGLDCIAIQSLGHDTALGRGAGARRWACGASSRRAGG